MCIQQRSREGGKEVLEAGAVVRSLLIVFALAFSARGKVLTVTYQVSAGHDDAYAPSASVQDANSAYLVIGDGAQSSPYHMSGMRFTDVEIPRVAQILSANLRIRSMTDEFRGQVYGVIDAEPVDDAADFGERHISAAARTLWNVVWDHKFAWDADTWQASPDISSVIGEVVNRDGWNSGNSLALFYSTRVDSGKSRNFASYEYNPTSAAVLEITYKYHSICGYVRYCDGVAASGVSITTDGNIKETITDVNGYYELRVPPGWSGEVIPILREWIFEPPSHFYTNVISDQYDQDFTVVNRREVNRYYALTYHADIFDTGCYIHSTKFHIGDGSLSAPFYRAGMLFKGTRVPRGAHIIQSNLRIGAHLADGLTGAVYGIIQCEDVDNAPWFYGGCRLYPNMTSASVNWDHIEDWIPGAYYVSPDISDVVQEVFDRPGWSWGNSLAVYYSTRIDSNEVRIFYSWTPRLEIIYKARRISGHILNPSGVPFVDVVVSADNNADSVLTDSNGFYQLMVPLDWSGTITYSKSGWPFDPPSRGYPNVVDDYADQDVTGASSLSIRGYVTDEHGTGFEGVSIETSDNIGSDISDSNGYYELIVPYNWSGTVTPDRAGWGFNPLSRVYSNLITNAPNQDYTIFQPKISGHITDPNGIGSPGVLVETDDGSSSEITDSNGYYQLTVVYNWSGTVAPNDPSVMFFPASHSYIDVNSDETNQDFISSDPLLISGHVYDSNNDPFEAVSVSADNDGTSDVTDSNGYYEVQVYIGWSGIVTPNEAGWGFLPPQHTYSGITTDQADQDYNGFQPIISGVLTFADGSPVLGATFWADNGGGFGVTDAGGYYEVIVPYGWSGTVTRNGGVAPLTPPGRSYSNVIADITDQNYTTLTATVSPDGSGDYMTIQAAIDAADNGDTIILGDGTFVGDGNIDIDFKGKAITVQSQNGPENCVVDCENVVGHRGFYFHQGETNASILSGITIRNGYVYKEGAGIYCVGASPTIDDCIITNNKCLNYSPTGLLWAYGGGVCCISGSFPILVDCTISNNLAQGGKGITFPQEGETYGVTGARARGGGAYCDSSSGIYAYGCSFINNTAKGGEGGDGDYTGNGGVALGGGLSLCSNRTSEVQICVFMGNSAHGGRAGSGSYGLGDGANGHGGAFYADKSSTVVRSCSFVNNSVYGGNAGAPGSSEGKGYGGGVRADINVMGCTFVNNSSEHYGGAVYGSATITNSILWNNNAPSYSEIGPSSGPLVSYSDIQGGFSGEGNIDSNPLFETPVNGVYHLTVNSPCINVGDPNYIGESNEVDIDGEIRVNGGRVDIGSDEFFRADGFIYLSEEQFDFTAYIDGNQPGPEVLVMSNMGPNDLSWEIAGSCPWLTVEPNSGICAAGGSGEVVLSVDTNGVSGGEHSCNLNVVAPGASNSPLGVVIGLRNYGPVISLSSNDIDFLASQADPYPGDQTFGISNGGISVLDWEISVPAGCTWLTVEPTAGQSSGEVNTVTLHVETSGLSEGFYGCDLTIGDYYAENNPQTVSVGLYVLETEGRLIVPGVFETIQKAVDMAVNGDEVLIVPGRYAGEGNFDIDFGGKAITVRSIDPNNPDTIAATIVDGNNSGWYPGCNQCDYSETGFGFIFENGEGPDSVIEGLTIIGSGWGGGIGVFGGSPTIRNCILRDNWGNGIYGVVSGDMTIANCTINRNRSIEMGVGGIALRGTGSVTITDCVIGDNDDWWDNLGGGGIAYEWWNEYGDPITMSIHDCSITGNNTGFAGGGILFEAGELLVEGCNVSGNSADEGGGIWLGQLAEANIVDCEITDNRARYGSGGGVYCTEGQLNMIGCELTGNSSASEEYFSGGGGLYIYRAGPGQIVGCNFSDNISRSSGGGIYSYDSGIMVRNCILANNESDVEGGAVACPPRERYPLSLINCIVSGNKAENFGALGPMRGPVSNCTIVGNYSDLDIAGGLPWGTMRNNIFWQNRSISGEVIGGGAQVTYSCVAGGYEGLGNIDVDPCFAIPGYWDANGTAADMNDDFWVDGDYHLKSQAGRWAPSPFALLDTGGDGFIDLGDYAAFAGEWGDVGGFIAADLDRSGTVDFNDLSLLLANYLADYNEGAWVKDDVTSDLVDAGNPGCPLADEANDVNNVRINMGAYGGTDEASRTPLYWGLLGDLTNDFEVYWSDIGAVGDYWLIGGECLSADLSRNGFVDFDDYCLLAETWLWWRY